ncbi:MAG TPA: hypothetical protein VMO26_29800 [Vicinamibacterales bacterium]|nr:hypothetical protein [Vicinamibacterales bacterium]
MSRDAMPREAARDNGFGRDVLRAYNAAVRRYGRELWVTGISVGIREVAGRADASAGPVIAIHVRRKDPDSRVPAKRRIPPTILGVPTDVVEGTYAHSSNGHGPSALPVFPLRPGSSYARHNGTAATLAAVVRDNKGTLCLLSAAHTLREGGKFKKGDLMVHPGPLDSQQPAGVSRYETVHLGMDAGIAKLEPGIQALNRALLTNQLIHTPEMPLIGDILEKVGRTTGITQAEVRNIGTFSGFHPAMRLVPLPGDPNPISDQGDSGSTWYDAVTSAAKGLHVAVDPHATPPAAIATLMPEIIRRMKLTWE